MEDKTIQVAQGVISAKRIEFLLEELIFQTILNRTSNVEEAKDKLVIALGNVDKDMKEYVESLPAYEEPFGYSV